MKPCDASPKHKKTCTCHLRSTLNVDAIDRLANIPMGLRFEVELPHRSDGLANYVRSFIGPLRDARVEHVSGSP